MSSQPYRTGQGGLIDRSRPLHFSFDGRALQGFEGDTLASALLANGVRLIGRSFKYHRPRGIFGSGAEEPNAMLQVGPREASVPNCRATQVVLTEGLEARSQNCWPSPGFDLMGISGRMAPLLSTGFYNKTFKWPRGLWPVYERLLRRAAGHGRAGSRPDDLPTEQLSLNVDVLVVGAGPAGLSAAHELKGSDLEVLLVDDSHWPGGWLPGERATIGGKSGVGWTQDVCSGFMSADNVRQLTQTTAFGYFDHDLVALVQRGSPAQPFAERLLRVRARQVIIATGAFERPLVFPNNDLPGVMLAGAARVYLNRYGVIPGHRALVFTSNDSAYRTAIDLADSGVDVSLADTRKQVPVALAEALSQRRIRHFAGASLAACEGKQLAGVNLVSEAGAEPVRIDCDLLAVSGGWTPAIHLHSQSGGRPRYEAALDTFVPGAARQSTITAGAVNGLNSLEDCLADGRRAAREAAARLGIELPSPGHVPDSRLDFTAPCKPPGAAPASPAGTHEASGGKQFVDFQNDVTIDDVRQAWQESYVSVEHLKRYTTLGMGTDQGKTSNLNGLGLLARLRDQPVPEVGMTTFRPPYTPVTLATLAGQRHGPRTAPVRRTPLHQRHEAASARFEFNGLWLRPGCYPRDGETAADAINREIRAVRQNIGMADISTLGKFEIHGSDSLEFLNRVCVNRIESLLTGRCRYVVMLHDGGFVLDDGTVTRLAENHWFMTVSSGHAEHMLQHFEFLLNCCWDDLDVHVAPVTEQWAAIALAGPYSREVLASLAGANGPLVEAIPYLGFNTVELGSPPDSVTARLFRISYSGELAYEIHVPARRGPGLWDALARAGARFGIQPYGLEAMDVMRIEKGFIAVGAEADGRATPMDLGLQWMMGDGKSFVGRQGLARPGLNEAGRLQVVGLAALDKAHPVREGAQLVNDPAARGYQASVGHVSSAGYSPMQDRYVALGMIRDGRARHGETVYCFDPARDPRQTVAVMITEPCSYDPGGARMRAG